MAESQNDPVQAPTAASEASSELERPIQPAPNDSGVVHTSDSLVAAPLAATLMRQRFFIATGMVAMVLAIIGAILPLLPTTPFVILASACFMRGSPRLHRALRANRWFGPSLRTWEDQRTVSRRAKALAIATIIISMSATGTFFLATTVPRLILASVGVVVCFSIYRLPSHRRALPEKS
jgi:uncharacterized membrane protein YbaN (DUF454 family)